LSVDFFICYSIVPRIRMAFGFPIVIFVDRRLGSENETASTVVRPIGDTKTLPPRVAHAYTLMEIYDMIAKKGARVNYCLKRIFTPPLLQPFFNSPLSSFVPFLSPSIS